MATPPKKPRRKSRPPCTEQKEWPVTDEDLEAMGDAALDELPLDAIEDFVVGGADPDLGFAYSAAQARSRSARLAIGLPDPRDVLSARRQKAFLMALSQTGNITIACAAAGWSRQVPLSLRRADKTFADRWEHATENAADILEAAALQRAVHGVQEDVWWKPKEGSPEVIGHKVIYSDKLLETLLKANRPEKFRERSEVKHEANKGGVLVVPAAMSMDDFEAAVFKQQAQFRERREGED